MIEQTVSITVDGLALVIDFADHPVRIEMSRQTAALIAFQLAAGVRAAPPPEPGDLAPPEELRLLFQEPTGNA